MSQRKTMFCTGLCNKVLMTSVGYVSGSALVVAPALAEGHHMESRLAAGILIVGHNMTQRSRK